MPEDFVIVGHIVNYPTKRLKIDTSGRVTVVAELNTVSPVVVDQICVLSETE